MYQDKRKRRWWILPVILLAAVICVSAFVLLGKRSGEEMRAEGAAAIEAALRRSAVQCYVVEGVYPPDFEYLQENYGLQVNTDDYYVVYEAFASNIPPTIHVLEK